jgi:hypothetical protein
MEAEELALGFVRLKSGVPDKASVKAMRPAACGGLYPKRKIRVAVGAGVYEFVSGV